MIDADAAEQHLPAYTGGTQLSGAEAFLRAHPGQVPYITIDVGINNVDGCLPGVPSASAASPAASARSRRSSRSSSRGSRRPLPECRSSGWTTTTRSWPSGCSAVPADPPWPLSRASLSATLNSSLVNTYGANRAVPVDVQGAFATQDFAMTGTWDGVTVPQNVARTCEWTYMCDNSGLTLHTNDVGHAKLAEPSSSRSTAPSAVAARAPGWPTPPAAST